MTKDEIHELEKKAMLLDRDQVLLLVSAFRTYRQAAEDLLQSVHQDGEIDAVDVCRFKDKLDEAWL